jgi:uncharacterized membrane protein YedE/YeeE
VIRDVVHALAGGALIGLSAALLFLVSGRIAGISGIVSGIFAGSREDAGWRSCFVTGLVAGGLVLRATVADAFAGLTTAPWGVLAVAGFLVGFGASLGSGCTSGHGVCGVGRLSPRSIAATLVFMAVGALTVLVVRHGLGVGA